jgi:hypothetical protein
MGISHRRLLASNQQVSREITTVIVKLGPQLVQSMPGHYSDSTPKLHGSYRCSADT